MAYETTTKAVTMAENSAAYIRLRKPQAAGRHSQQTYEEEQHIHLRVELVHVLLLAF